MYKIIIADDDYYAIKETLELIKIFPGYAVVDTITEINQLMFSIIKHKPELLILDINFRKGNDFDLAKNIKALNLGTEIIFATKHIEHAMDAFDCEACGYLMKPISVYRLKQALNHFEKHKQDNQFERNTNEWPLRFNTLEGFLLIKPMDILCLIADQVYTTIYTLDKQKHHISINIGKIETMLDKDVFIRSSRSSIINVNYLKEVSRKNRTCTLGKDNTSFEVKISKTGIYRLEQIFICSQFIPS